MKTGRKRKTGVRRSKTGKSLGEPHVVHPESVAVRTRELVAAGFPIPLATKYATDALAGFTLGVLYLGGKVDETQYNTGQSWSRIVHRHAAVMGYRLTIRTPSFMLVGSGLSTGTEPDEKEIANIRGRFRDCWNALASEARVHGFNVTRVVTGVCIENWPAQSLSEADVGNLRIGLNALAKAL